MFSKRGLQGRCEETERGYMTDRRGEFVPCRWSFFKRRSADHFVRKGRILTPGCLQKNGAAEKECKGEEDLRGR